MLPKVLICAPTASAKSYCFKAWLDNVMNFTYPKSEKLKSKTTIDLLFSKGKSVSKYPLRLVYKASSLNESEKIKMGVSVSKKNFKKAVGILYKEGKIELKENLIRLVVEKKKR